MYGIPTLTNYLYTGPATVVNIRRRRERGQQLSTYTIKIKIAGEVYSSTIAPYTALYVWIQVFRRECLGSEYNVIGMLKHAETYSAVLWSVDVRLSADSLDY